MLKDSLESDDLSYVALEVSRSKKGPTVGPHELYSGDRHDEGFQNFTNVGFLNSGCARTVFIKLYFS